MHPPDADTVVIRHGEIGVKSPQVQRSMEGDLRNNVAAMLADRGIEGTVEREHSRLYIRTPTEAIEAATDAAADTFGVVSASPALAVDPTLAAITDALGQTATECFPGGAFAVRARRAGKAEAHAFSTQDILEKGGDAVWTAIKESGHDPVVDLDDPDWAVHVEARPDRAYVFLEYRDGPGGLPVGTQAPLVALVSGGIDSPVAAWLAMKRGAPIKPLYIDLGDFGGADHRARAEATVADLARYAPHLELTLRVAPGGEAIRRLVTEMDSYRMLALRRFMLAVADRVAADCGAVGIVTGESIGQKSSQTTANLQVTDSAATLPIHRPLIGMDKDTITERARAIGTFDDATIAAGCNRIAPDTPATAADRERVRSAEPDELFDLAEEAAASVSTIPEDTFARA
ncbi:MAG: tRNA sulfurtransferase [Salinirussus sp.]